MIEWRFSLRSQVDKENSMEKATTSPFLRVIVQEKNFDPFKEDLALQQQIQSRGASSGAMVAFVGRVRGNDQQTPLKTLTLEHFPKVTENEILRIAKKAAQRWTLEAATVIHRVGSLTPGENIVLTLTYARHRHDAYEANRFIMDYLKTQAPFWKKETFFNGESHWVEARESDLEALTKWA